MPKTIVSCLTLLCAVPALAQQDDATSPSPANVVAVNVLANLGGAYSIEYERVLSPALSLFVEPTYFQIGPNPGFGSLGIAGPGLVVGARWYPFGAAPAGLFVAPEVYATYIDSLGLEGGPQAGAGGGAVVGWNFVLFDRLVLSPGVGATVNVLGYNLSGQTGIGWLPVIRANVGVAF